MTFNIWHTGDCLEFMRQSKVDSFDTVIGDPPYGEPSLINAFVEDALRVSRGAVVAFMYPEDLVHLSVDPAQVCHWVKPVSTKNTTKRYSRFVEAIAIWPGAFFNQDLHWSTRTGVFTDSLISQGAHPFKKPDSLIEKLLLLHTPPGGRVLDCFGGSGTVHDACVRLGFDSETCELDAKWARP